MPPQIRIATRRSKLAMIQANMVRDALIAWLDKNHHDCEVTLLPLQTTGDARKDANLADIGGKGVFTKEIEDALLNGEAEIAMHSLKDVPASMPKGLILAGALPREDYRDALMTKTPLATLDALPQHATVGTSSPRRAGQLLHARPDLNIIPFRGNVPTRLEKLERGEIDATLLAVAGLKRLGLEKHISLYMSPEVMLPAIGQGIVTMQCCEENAAIRQLLKAVTHGESWYQLLAERAVLEVIGGDCRSPIAGLARIQGDHLMLDGLITSEDGQKMHHERLEGTFRSAVRLGTELGETLQRHVDRIWG